MSLEEAQRRLAEVRQETSKPLNKLDSMVRAQRSIDSLRDITKSMKQLIPLTASTSDRHSRSNGAAQQEPIVPPDTAAFLQVLHRKAIADEDLKEKYQRVVQQRAVASLHLSSQATPPTGEYAQVLQSKTDPFQSNEERVRKIVSLTPRSLAKQRGMVFPGGSSPHEHEDDAHDGEEDEALKQKKSNSNMRSLADSLATTRTDELLEKSVVLQASKQDFQGNLSLKKAVQLAMAAQHAQQIETMKRTFEQRLSEAVTGAREEGLIVGRKEGSDNSRAQLVAQQAKIDEMEQHIERLQSLATQSFVEKETTVTKVHFVRDERNKCEGLLRKYEDVHVDEVLQKSVLYEHEREYLYAKAFRSAPDWDPQLFSNAALSRRFSMHPSTSHGASTSTFRSPRSVRSAARHGRRQQSIQDALLQLLRMHEALCKQAMGSHDINANLASSTSGSAS